MSDRRQHKYTSTYVRRMAQNAELRVHVSAPGDGKTRYDFYDLRDRNEAHVLFHAVGGEPAAAFISGYLAGRNREIIAK